MRDIIPNNFGKMRLRNFARQRKQAYLVFFFCSNQIGKSTGGRERERGRESEREREREKERKRERERLREKENERA